MVQIHVVVHVTLDLCAAISTPIYASQPQFMLVHPNSCFFASLCASLLQFVLVGPNPCQFAPLADKAAAEKDNESLQVDDKHCVFCHQAQQLGSVLYCLWDASDSAVA